MRHRLRRREFLVAMGGFPSGAVVSEASFADDQRNGDMLFRKLGRTGERVAAIGLGGYHIGLPPDEQDSIRLIRSAIDRGIHFLDNSWDYLGGRCDIWMGQALRDGCGQTGAADVGGVAARSWVTAGPSAGRGSRPGCIVEVESTGVRPWRGETSCCFGQTVKSGSLPAAPGCRGFHSVVDFRHPADKSGPRDAVTVAARAAPRAQQGNSVRSYIAGPVRG